ncbi:hypothetical protein KG088_17420 [Halomonas sp. TRM85114]|uniref:hypothetical protein n=1 Tax=Halomonas jincaotanensis TaxID=2810616 RepID=UPI001BD40977|nr:hypothetical protein [Halomonas jincaotanensis]MBS9405390.1 hypothetical protein [Halomonas jincaotanensis]
MRLATFMIFSFAIACWVDFAAAQVQLRHPDQFYTNGEKSDGWTRDSEKRLRSTFWFAKNPESSLSYQQQIVIVYDKAPNKAYYFDTATKQFIGWFDLATERYSLLSPEYRRERIEEIDESWFPPPSDLPTIGEMFEIAPADLNGNFHCFIETGKEVSQPMCERENPNIMRMPPPTAQFPRLHASSWDTSYTNADGSRVRARVDLKGDSGTYQLTNNEVTGDLSNIKYIIDQEVISITGQWALQDTGGYFVFNVPKDNMDVFWGDWGFVRDSIYGTWSGIRRPR